MRAENSRLYQDIITCLWYKRSRSDTKGQLNSAIYLKTYLSYISPGLEEKGCVHNLYRQASAVFRRSRARIECGSPHNLKSGSDLNKV
jgi:hypothetical protein